MTTGSFWEENELERKVVEVLSGVTYDSSHHFGRPFLTAYQLAILVKDRFPDTFSLLGYPLGEGEPVFATASQVTWRGSCRRKSRTGQSPT